MDISGKGICAFLVNKYLQQHKKRRGRGTGVDLHKKSNTIFTHLSAPKPNPFTKLNKS